jgi:RNA polymerase sigma-70 factor (ECF subfamily)
MAETAPAILNDEAFKNELVRVLPHLRAFARGLCGRPDYADDLVQETAIKAWNARERFEAGTHLRAWTFTILRNHYLSELRRNRHHADVDDEVHEKLLVMEADQEDTLHLADMQTALNKISSERREAILLVGASGFTYEEAAEICGCAVGTVKSRVARARADLARLLNSEMPGDPE